MSGKSKSAPDSSELLKKFEVNCKNFINMSNTEKSDLIKLNYLSGLQKSAITWKIPPKVIVECIFQNLLFKKIDLIKSPNILLAFISFCKENDEFTFQKYFYELLYKFLSNYEENEIYFKNYLILFSLEIFFDSINNNDNIEEDIDIRKKYFSQIIYTDINEFQEQFFKFVINEKIKIINNKIKFNFIKNFFEILLIKNEYHIGILLLKLIKEELNGNNFPNELITKIISVQNKSGFNIISESNKSTNDFFTFTELLIQNTSKDFINNKKNENIFDFYFLNLLNILCVQKEFNTNIINHCFDYYKINKTKILTKIFPEIIYHLSNFAYTNKQISFLFNTICLSDSNIINHIYCRIIYKNPILFKKSTIIKTNFKPSLENVKIIIDNKEQDEDDTKKETIINSIINHILFINKDQSNIYLLIYLTIYNYIINSSFSLNEKEYIINLHSLNKTLQIISNLSIEKISDSYSEFFLQFILDYLSIIFEFCLSTNDLNSNLDIVLKTFNSFFLIIKKLAKNDQKQLGLVFPSLMNLLDKNIKIEISEPLLDYFIETFARKTRQCDLIFKKIKAILIITDKNNFENKFYLADKLINLVIQSNEHKSFESLFSLCNELFKGNEIFSQNLGQYIINKYSKLYEGALSNLLENYILSKFDENFLQKKFCIEEISDDGYNILNTLHNIYLQDKTDNLNQIVDKLFGDEYRTIINIFNELFKYMETNDNNKNVFNFNFSENLIEQYSDMKLNLNNIIDFYSFIKQDYIINNDFFKTNKKILLIYGISYYLAKLLGQYLSDKIIKENELQNEEEKKVEIDKLMILFNYLHEKIILNKEIKNIYFKSFFLNAILSERKILEFYFIKHTNILVNEEIEKKELDYSHLTKLSSNLNSKKSNKLIELFKDFPLNIILIKDLIFELFSFESETIINPKKEDKYNDTKHSNNRPYVKNPNTNKLIKKIKEKDNNNNNSNNNNIDDLTLRKNSSFSKIFCDLITNLSKRENMEKNQPYYLFCLDNDIFYSYYNSLCDFYDFDYAIFEFYSLIRDKKCKLEYKEKFFKFLNDFKFIKNVFVFNIRIFSEEITFNKLISLESDNHSEKMSGIFCDIIISLLKNLLIYNSYENYVENSIINIINNIFKYTKDLLILFKDKNSKEKIVSELDYFIKIINYIFETFSTEENNFTDKPISKLDVNYKLIKNINTFIDEKYNPKNSKCYEINNNKDLFEFLQTQENLNDKNKKDLNSIYIFLEDDAIISNYNENMKKIPFPLEQLMNEYGFNKHIIEN